MKSERKAALIILDGWGLGPEDNTVNAIAAANTPFIDSLYENYPHSQLVTYGESVGLPEGQMGNSEVGHMNLGAGRVVYQQLVLINKAFTNGEAEENPVLNEAFKYAKSNGKKIHLIGLVSAGGVHSSMDHLKGLLTIAHNKKAERVFVHAFTDGRDTDPKSGDRYIEEIETHAKLTTGKIASVIGRYYAMDRDKRWERVKLAYDLLVQGQGEHAQSANEAIEKSYQEGLTDEFIKPIAIVENGQPLATIEEGDVVIFFNFRTDRGRELTVALTQQAFPEYEMKPLSLHYITMTPYDATYKDVKTIFKEEDLSMTLGEVIEKAGGKQLRMAETEKYPHVTYFFSGGRELPFEGEKRLMAPSPKVATYDLKPSMSANELTDLLVNEIKTEDYNLVVLNFANPDMVGHTGVFSAIMEAVETIDKCTERVVNACIEKGYAVIIIADHGNADFAVNHDGTPNTAHTKNPVPCILIDPKKDWHIKNGKLADIAPTILHLLGIDIPQQMNGQVLVEAGD